MVSFVDINNFDVYKRLYSKGGIMQSFNEWRGMRESVSTTVYSINELIERLEGLSPNFSEIQAFKILPDELNMTIQKARKHYDEAIEVLKSVAYKQDPVSKEFFGDKQFNREG